MKKIRTILLTLAVALTTAAQADNYTYLTVSQQGAENSFEVSGISKITFDTTHMTLHLSNGTQQQLPLAGLTKMFFSDKGTSGIAAIEADEPQTKLEGGLLKVKAKAGAPITIYTTTGTVVKSLTAKADETELHLGDLKKGVYIVKVGKATKKIANN